MKLTMTRPMITKKAIVRYVIVVHSTSYAGPRSDGCGGVPIPRVPLPDMHILHQKWLHNQASLREAGYRPSAADDRSCATSRWVTFDAFRQASGMIPCTGESAACPSLSARSLCGD